MRVIAKGVWPLAVTICPTTLLPIIVPVWAFPLDGGAPVPYAMATAVPSVATVLKIEPSNVTSKIPLNLGVKVHTAPNPAIIGEVDEVVPGTPGVACILFGAKNAAGIEAKIVTPDVKFTALPELEDERIFVRERVLPELL